MISGINISKVKKIYPVLVLYDRVFSLVFMNRYLNSEFKRFMKCHLLQKHLKVMPLTVLAIDNLEDLEPYLCDLPLYAHLDEWIRVFNNNKSCPVYRVFTFFGEKGPTREQLHRTGIQAHLCRHEGVFHLARC